jgi:hypothetical protein
MPNNPAIIQGNYGVSLMKSVNRPLIHTFGNTFATLPYNKNRFIYDIYINGTMVLREYKALTYDNYAVYTYLDVAPIIKNYLQSSINSPYPAFISYQIKYGYEDLSGTITTNYATDTSYAWYGYPAFLNDTLLPDLGLTTYGGALPLYLSTNRNRVINSFGNYSVYIPIFKSQTYVGGTVNFGTLSNPATYSFTDSLDAVGVYNAKLTYGILFGDTNNLYFDIDGDALENVGSNTIGVNFNCTKNNPVMIHFLNSIGGFESFLFSGVNRVNTNIERQSINKLGLITKTTNLVTPPPFPLPYTDVAIARQIDNTLGEGKINYSNTMTHKMKLVSDYISETDFLWLRELLASPQVYAQIDNNSLMIPITIETSDWAEKKRGADKIFNLEIDILLGTQSTQLR